MVILRGLTWDHPRATLPLDAASRRWSELHPEVEVRWERRSLRAFGEESLEEASRAYDLIIVDHPLIGDAAESDQVVPFGRQDDEVFNQMRTDSVGRSFESYGFAGQVWALPVDASAQVAAWRPDLLDDLGVPPPETWEEVLTLAKDTRRVTIPLRPIDALCAFFTLSAATRWAEGRSSSVDPVGTEGANSLPSFDREAARQALGQLGSLVPLTDPECFDHDPIETLELAGRTDDIAYVPLTFAYSNYARSGFVPCPLAFGDIPCGGAGGATLGGAGMAITSNRTNLDEAVAFSLWLADPEQQHTIVAESGGQPASRSVWETLGASEITGGFFRALLPTLERAYVRPNPPGFGNFQSEAGRLVRDGLRARDPADVILDRMAPLYERWFPGGSP